MLRTRVGYAGGTTPEPTYHSIGDHSETIEIDFQPERISYSELLEIFFRSHNPRRAAFRPQYRSAILFASKKPKEKRHRSHGAHR